MTPKIKQTKLTDYQPDPDNLNEHTERGMDMLGNSLQETGWGRSMVVDKDGVLIAGNGAQEAGVDAGFEEAIEIETDGTKPIIIRRTDLDLDGEGDAAEKARLLSIYDNRTAQVNLRWNVEGLNALREGNFDGIKRAFTAAELAIILGRMDALGEVAPPGFDLDAGDSITRLENSAIRQIVLYYDQDTYVSLIERCGEIMQERQLETNSDLFQFLVEWYEDHRSDEADA